MIPATPPVESALNRARGLSGTQWSLSRFLPLQPLHHSRQTNSELRHESQTKTNVGTLGQGCLRPLAPALGEQLPLLSQAILPRVNSGASSTVKGFVTRSRKPIRLRDQSLDLPGPAWTCHAPAWTCHALGAQPPKSRPYLLLSADTSLCPCPLGHSSSPRSALIPDAFWCCGRCINSQEKLRSCWKSGKGNSLLTVPRRFLRWAFPRGQLSKCHQQREVLQWKR